jgi:hypothetical protein
LPAAKQLLSLVCNLPNAIRCQTSNAPLLRAAAPSGA